MPRDTRLLYLAYLRIQSEVAHKGDVTKSILVGYRHIATARTEVNRSRYAHVYRISVITYPQCERPTILIHSESKGQISHIADVVLQID